MTSEQQQEQPYYCGFKQDVCDLVCYRPHPAPTPSCQTCVDEMAIFCQDCPNLIKHLSGELKKSVAEHDAAIIRQAREDVLNRLDKEITTRENEMNRKGNLEDNLTTATGYLTAAGALNWVRVVLIDGSRDTIDGDALRQHTGQAGDPK